MKTPKPKYRCDNCGSTAKPTIPWKHLVELGGTIQRLDVGGPVPAGECKCGAFTYLIKPAKPADTIDQATLLENAIAISDSFHVRHKEYQRFYSWFGEQLGGFPGIWKWLADASEAFTIEEQRYDFDGQWIDTCEAFATELLLVDKLPNQQQLQAIARRIFKKHKVKLRKS